MGECSSALFGVLEEWGEELKELPTDTAEPSEP